MIEQLWRRTAEEFASVFDVHRPAVVHREVGRLRALEKGIARVVGLPGVKAMEVVRFEGGALGVALNLDPEELGVVLLGDYSEVAAGAEVERTGRVVDVPVGNGLLGRVVDGVGHPLDDKGALRAADRWPVEREAPAIRMRAPVTAPLQTGLKVVDALIPIGRGQRQLIVGDRQTGKTAVAVDTLLNQRGRGVIGVYCAIGQRGVAVARVVEKLRGAGAMQQCVVVVAAGEEPPGLQYVAPYAATSIAEFFMEQGRDVVVVYDDLTRHAHAYRELSLLLRRPPGREAYPGDIFYIHSRLLERATHLREEAGGGSLTALPIIETQAQNLSAYIPTNLISITDGQIYLSPKFFQKGDLPAVDVGRSVSRVGGKAQLKAYRQVAGELRLSFTQFEELETFARFGTRLDEETRRTIERGRRVREVLKQNEGDSLSAVEQLMVLLAVNNGLFDELDLSMVGEAETRLRQVADGMKSLRGKIERGELLEDEDVAAMLEVAREALGMEAR